MRRFMCLLLAFSLIFCFSVSSYAYSSSHTADELANKLYSGWSDTSTPLSGSWYALIKLYLSQMKSKIDLWLPYLASLGSSTDGNGAYTLVGTSKFLHYILGNNTHGTLSDLLYSIDTSLKKQVSSSWTSSQATTVTDNTSAIFTALSSISDKLIHIQPIYEKTFIIDRNVSSINNTILSLFNDWSLENPIDYNNKRPGSWFGIVGQYMSNLHSSFIMEMVDVSSMADVDFGRSNWYKGVYGSIYRLQQVLANDDDLQMRKDTEENRTSFNDNFLDSSADNSVKVSDITAVSNLSSGLKKNFDTGVSPLSLFDFLNDENPFSWFTEECKNSMVSVSSSSRRSPSVSSPYGDYAREHMHDYYNRLEGVKRVD